MALERNPTLVQAAARINMAKGKALQAGLYPNPTIGYSGEQMGALGTPGERQGAFIQQEIVTAGKLKLSRAKYEQEAHQAEIQFHAQQLRVVNGVRIAFYEVLAAQRSLATHQSLAAIAGEGVKTTQELLNVGQANQPDLLQAQVEANRAKVHVKKAARQFDRSWERLIAMVGAPELAPAALAGQLEPQGAPLAWDEALGRLLRDSPELKFVRAEVIRDQITVQREKVEPIPNIQFKGTTGYNFETRNTTADAQIGIRLPIFNRNQGTVQQAESELVRARADVTRVELDLRRRLANVFSQYRSAWASVQDYRANTLPASQKAFELYQEYFKKRQATWPQVLVAQRTLAQLQEDYIASMLELRTAEVQITGLLLVDGLSQPPGPTPQGHIEATPQPR